jgi:hypothetical protein
LHIARECRQRRDTMACATDTCRYLQRASLIRLCCLEYAQVAARCKSRGHCFMPTPRKCNRQHSHCIAWRGTSVPAELIRLSEAAVPSRCHPFLSVGLAVSSCKTAPCCTKTGAADGTQPVQRDQHVTSSYLFNLVGGTASNGARRTCCRNSHHVDIEVEPRPGHDWGTQRQFLCI